MGDKPGPGRDHERLPQHPGLNKPVDIAKKMLKLGKDIQKNIVKQTGEDARKRILDVLLKYRDECPTEADLVSDYSPIKSTAFDFSEFLTSDGKLDERMLRHLAVRYIANFSAEGLDFVIGEYQGRYAVYLKNK